MFFLFFAGFWFHLRCVCVLSFKSMFFAFERYFGRLPCETRQTLKRCLVGITLLNCIAELEGDDWDSTKKKKTPDQPQGHHRSRWWKLGEFALWPAWPNPSCGSCPEQKPSSNPLGHKVGVCAREVGPTSSWLVVSNKDLPTIYCQQIANCTCALCVVFPPNAVHTSTHPLLQEVILFFSRVKYADVYIYMA